MEADNDLPHNSNAVKPLPIDELLQLIGSPPKEKNMESTELTELTRDSLAELCRKEEAAHQNELIRLDQKYANDIEWLKIEFDSRLRDATRDHAQKKERFAAYHEEQFEKIHQRAVAAGLIGPDDPLPGQRKE